MQKWEYCLLYQFSPSEFWLMRTTEGVEKIKNPAWGLESILRWLGEEGWEAVNFGFIPPPGGGILLRGIEQNFGQNSQILFKRRLE